MISYDSVVSKTGLESDLDLARRIIMLFEMSHSIKSTVIRVQNIVKIPVTFDFFSSKAAQQES